MVRLLDGAILFQFSLLPHPSPVQPHLVLFLFDDHRLQTFLRCSGLFFPHLATCFLGPPFYCLLLLPSLPLLRLLCVFPLLRFYFTQSVPCCLLLAPPGPAGYLLRPLFCESLLLEPFPLHFLLLQPGPPGLLLHPQSLGFGCFPHLLRLALLFCLCSSCFFLCSSLLFDPSLFLLPCSVPDPVILDREVFRVIPGPFRYVTEKLVGLAYLPRERGVSSVPSYK